MITMGFKYSGKIASYDKPDKDGNKNTE
jgi:hypothetical protein